MLSKVYTVYDCKALVYSPPFYAATHGAAVRIFQEVANDTNTSVGRHPVDYSLWCIGTFDDQAGQVAPSSPLEHVADAASLVLHQARLPLTDKYEAVAEQFEKELING